MNTARANLRSSWQGDAADRAGAARNPFTGTVSCTSGSGSLEGEGKLMAVPRNFGRSCGFLPEGTSCPLLFDLSEFFFYLISVLAFALFAAGKRFLQWLKNEGTINESIVVELFERARWKRP